MNFKLKSFFLASIMAVAALPGSTATPRAKGNLCGAAVGGACCSDGTDCGNDAGCTTMLYDAVEGDTSFECYSYSGPCSIGYAGDAGDSWQNQDPSKCMGDTFFLWDEPIGTQGRDMNWVVNTWKSFVQRYDTQLRAFRNRGGIVTAPMFRVPCGTKLIQFLEQCGDFCTNSGSNGYIGSLAGNYFGSRPDDEGSLGSAGWVIGDMAPATSKYRDLPVYITNWANGVYEKGIRDQYGRTACNDPACQYADMKAAKLFLDKGWKVFWFATVDCADGDCNKHNFSNNRLTDMGPNGITMGQEWKKICDTYPHSGPSPSPSPGPSPGPTPGGECKSYCVDDRSQHQVEGCTPSTEQCRHCSGNTDDSLAQDCGGCSYCHSAGPCRSYCADDRFSEPGREARHCSGDMADRCGGCSYCSNRSNSARSEL